MLLAAVHPWDIHGAAEAGLRTAWVSRTGGPYPEYFRTPDLTVRALDELAPLLTTRSR
jgi:2-haloacid dehalogenase